jgi:Flp pilus assembly protein TadB
MPASDRTLVTVAGAACVVCCLPLIVAAGPVLAVGGAVAVAVAASVASHAVRTRKRKRIETEPGESR